MSLEDKLQSLGKQLSSEASIVLSSDPQFSISATRWSDFERPEPGAVIHAATEADVEHTASLPRSQTPVTRLMYVRFHGQSRTT